MAAADNATQSAKKPDKKPGTKPGAKRGSYKQKPKRVPVTVRVLEDDEIFAEFAASQHNVGLSLELMVRHFYQLYPELVGEDIVLEMPAVTQRVAQQQPVATAPATQQQQQQKKNISRATTDDDGDTEDAAEDADSAAADDDAAAESTPEVEVEDQGEAQVEKQSTPQNTEPQSTDDKLAAMRDAAFANPNDDVLAGLLDM